MNKENLKYEGCDLYQVETDDDGNKQVHIDGYCYCNENEWQLVQFTFCYLDFSEIDRDNLEQAYEWTKQYQYEFDEEQVCNYYKDAKELPYEELTQDTKDGWYIDYKPTK